MKPLKERCKKTIYSRGSFRGDQCSKLIWKEGFCRIHHPESVKKRQEKSDRYFEAQRENSPYVRLSKEIGRLKSINADLLEVAKRVIAEWNADWDMPQELIEMAKQSIAKAEGKE